jgi:hypothetical protein
MRRIRQAILVGELPELLKAARQSLTEASGPVEAPG